MAMRRKEGRGEEVKKRGNKKKLTSHQDGFSITMIWFVCFFWYVRSKL